MAEELTRTPKRMGEAERRVVDAFITWLQSQGWRTWTEVDYLDVLAERDGCWLRAEAKSHTGESAGLDVDTAFGQLLRRMDDDDEVNVRYAIVVPPGSLDNVMRVPRRVRELLRIDVYVVDPDTRSVHLEPRH
jgi:hypothetical protein